MSERRTKPLRVLMLLENDRYPQDGRVRQEAETLIKAGHVVSVIAPKGRGQPWREVIDDVRVYRFRAPREAEGFAGYVWEYLYATTVMFAFSLLLGVWKGFDVVHAHNPPDVLVCIGAFYKLFGKFFVYDHHDLAPEMYEVRFSGEGKRIVHRTLVIFEKLSCRLADHVIATNESYKTVEVGRARIPAERVSIVRNGPELKLFQGSQAAVDLRCGEEQTVLCYVGTIGFQDGLDYLIRALHHLVRDLGRDDFLCLIVGSGDAWESTRDLATNLGLDGNVRFTGQVPYSDVPRYVAAADICVDPDPSNAFNDRSTMIKMMEYMAMQKPIVAFDLPEHRRTAGEAADYAAPNSEIAFAELIRNLMDDPDRRRRMGAIGGVRVETQLAWVHQERNLLNAYEGLRSTDLGRNRGPKFHRMESSSRS